jgi:pilus assembly protein CpaB
MNIMNRIVAAWAQHRKTGVVLLAALLIGLLAAWGARSYLGQRVAEIEARSQVKTVGVVVAKTEIAVGQALSSANLAVRDVPEEYQQSGAVSPSQFDRIDGEKVAYNLRPGEMLMWAMLESKKAPTFSSRVAPGRRAITVPVDDINSISGMLEPGDLVDLFITIDRAGKKMTAPLMSQVKVLATGQRAADEDAKGDQRFYTTATFDVGQAEAENLILAREVGKLTALLRHPDDRVGAQGKLLDVRKLVQSPDEPFGVTGPHKVVPVLYGGRSAKFSAEELQMAGPNEAPSRVAGPDRSTQP